ncbi:hypothetical protein VW29_02725 [Devosia limi DSM 17137]|uniref:Arc-like DNA binding domain-containing protein n=1 Tax=Devosia limi DSM 17137 TaxID=1121477 RepID=A0A0F5LVT6_9HYPH|nr:Arc family DNA-binding protein [Devosia limi]KKB86485.1 hypothetical protein VW29_02725 [Devosia limi DSM 17137]SHE87093.1 Arc-like DNA binding domain-containing protein [Devosia limi DSM 17137]
MARVPLQPQDKYVLRMPDGMRDRIKKAAERSGRSMNAEILAALEHFYPEEPSIIDLLDNVHDAISLAEQQNGMPYRQVLIDRLNDLSARVSAGLEFDQYRQPRFGAEYDRANKFADRYRRWRRVQEYGVEQSDLEDQLKKGMLHNARGDTVRQALKYFEAGKPEMALRLFRLHETKFADPDAAHQAIRSDLQSFFDENWGDLTQEDWDAPDDD